MKVKRILDITIGPGPNQWKDVRRAGGLNGKKEWTRQVARDRHDTRMNPTTAVWSKSPPCTAIPIRKNAGSWVQRHLRRPRSRAHFQMQLLPNADQARQTGRGVVCCLVTLDLLFLVVVRSHRHRCIETRIPNAKGYSTSFVTAGWQLNDAVRLPGCRRPPGPSPDRGFPCPSRRGRASY
jgi:hypothetical protein